MWQGQSYSIRLFHRPWTPHFITKGGDTEIYLIDPHQTPGRRIQC